MKTKKVISLLQVLLGLKYFMNAEHVSYISLLFVVFLNIFLSFYFSGYFIFQ
jgi:hypothetical protein